MLDKGKCDLPFESLRLTTVIIEHQINKITAAFKNAFSLNDSSGSTEIRLCSETLIQIHSEGLGEEGLCLMEAGFVFVAAAKQKWICRKQVGELNIELNTELLYGSAIPFLGIYTQRIKK